MTPTATVAQLTWLGASLPSWTAYGRALAAPDKAQWSLLQRQLVAHRDSAYGYEHNFAGISSYSDFTRKVPLVTYDDLSPWIRRIMRGERAVLTTEPVTRLVPTSGSTGARKLIPFTASLKRQFDAALSPWLVDLAGQQPAIAFGPAYWSITPVARSLEPEASAVPIGFGDDSEYLGEAHRRLVDTTLAAPTSLNAVGDINLFRRLTLLFLLHAKDLRLISVWHPSFLTLLLDALPAHWDELLRDIENGGCADAAELPQPLRQRVLRLPPRPQRAAVLRKFGPTKVIQLWPKLRVVSCWGDANARFAMQDLQRRLPHLHVQPKGLLATEALVTIPFQGQHPLAVRSHFFEFIDERGGVHPAHALRLDETYEPVVTTSGGLWRYRMHDRVRVTGFVKRTPSLEFLGRNGRVSDRFGEKLSEAFVSQVLHTLFVETGAATPQFAMLAPEEGIDGRCHYTLFIEGAAPQAIADRLDRALRKNPHYDYCRDLEQLHAAQACEISRGAYERFVAAEMEMGMRLGDIKPAALSLRTDWRQRLLAADTAVCPELR